MKEIIIRNVKVKKSLYNLDDILNDILMSLNSEYGEEFRLVSVMTNMIYSSENYLCLCLIFQMV
jgi:hypothetical protein